MNLAPAADRSRRTRLHGTAHVVPDAAALARCVADWFTRRIAARPAPVRIALCGGRTPRDFYALLASPGYRDRLPWAAVHWYWSDERRVPYDDPDSNYGMFRDRVLSRVAVPRDRVHPIAVTGEPAADALQYQVALRRTYGAERLDPSRPLFDINVLGLGADGHTASLLPGAAALGERHDWVAVVPEGPRHPRITLTYPALESSGTIAFLVTGRDKADVVARVRAGDTGLPAGALDPLGEVLWFLDADAAREEQ